MREIQGRFLKKARSHSVHLSNRHLSVDGFNIVTKDKTNRFVSTVDEATKHIENIDPIRNKVNRIACFLNENRVAEAVFLANFFDWRDPQHGSFLKAGFNPAEPRGYHGQWGDELAPTHRDPLEIAYQGKYHDEVVKDIQKVLESQGSIVLRGVRVLGLNARSAVPDGLVKPKGSNPYFFEVKIGMDPKPTIDQDFVYPLICIGGHATSSDPRVAQLGLTPGVPFPPMDIWFAVQGGAADKTIYFNYCEAIGIRRKFNAP